MSEPGSRSEHPRGDWTLAVDRERCMGTGTCMTYAPATIHLDEEGKAAIDGSVSDDLDVVRAAVESCPTQALTIVDIAN